MGRVPSHIGRAPAHLTVLPGGAGAGLDDLDDERTTIEPEPSAASDEAPTPIAAASASMDEQWEDGTTVAEDGDKRVLVDEPTVEDQARPLPPLQLVQGTATGADDPRSLAKLQVIAGSDQGRVFDLRPGKELSVGRAVDNDVVLTDIAVSRRHLELAWDGDAWVLRDRGSGNGTLINERIEDGRCQLRDGDRIEIGNTVFRFDHPPSAAQPTVTGWGQEEEEAATVAGKSPGPARTPSSPPIAAPAPERPRPNSVTAAAERRQPPPPGTRAKRPSQTPEARPATVRGMPVADPRRVPAASSPPPVEGVPVALPQFLGAVPQSGGASGAVSAPVPMLSGPPSGPVTAAQAIVSPAFGLGARPATTTALVEPRTYAPAPYPFIVAPEVNRRKHILIGAAVATALALIGVGAMLAGGDEPPAVADVGVKPAAGSSAAPVTPPPVADPRPVPVPEPVPVPAPVLVADAPVAPPVTPVPAPPVPPVPAPTPAIEPPVVAEVAPTPPPTIAPTPPVVAKKPPAVVEKRPPAVRPKVTPKVTARNDDLLAVDKKPPPKGLAGVEKRADGLYRAKDWKGASSTLREAAATASDADAKRLRALAADYDSIGTNLNAGTTLAKAKATDALGALKKALAADRRAGGAHQQVIREKMAQVAPSAAAAYMAKQNYPMAKLAADDAVNVGAGSNSTVANVRSSLERKAGEFFASAQQLMKDKPEEAKPLLRSIIKIVPADSPWYGKAYKLLNQRKPAAADEDE